MHLLSGGYHIDTDLGKCAGTLWSFFGGQHEKTGWTFGYSWTYLSNVFALLWHHAPSTQSIANSLYLSLLFTFLSSPYIAHLQVEKEIGERRLVGFHGTGLSVAPEISFSDVTADCNNPNEVFYFTQISKIKVHCLYLTIQFMNIYTFFLLFGRRKKHTTKLCTSRSMNNTRL